MTWLQPWAAWFLAGLPLIVLLYLLKVRRRTATVSTLIFWQRALQEHRRRALFQKLRHLFSLLLHLIIFALIVAAIARPTLDNATSSGASTVLVIDTRARMQAIEPDGDTRMTKALRRAQQVVRDASQDRQFAIVTMGPQAGIAAAFTGNERTLHEALDRMSATDGTGDPATARQLANDLLASRTGDKRIVAITNSPMGDGIETLRVGSARDNVAITAFSTRQLPASPQTSEVFLELSNYSGSAAEGNLELRYDDKLLDVKPWRLAAGASTQLFFPSVPRPTRSSRGWLTARLDKTDAFPVDDTARALLPPPRSIRVLLVTTGNVFLEKALAADPDASFELISPDGWSDALASKFDVIVHDQHVPANWAKHRSLFVQKTPFDAPGALLETPPITDIDVEHPTLRLLDFRSTIVLRSHPLTVPPSTDEWIYAAPLRSFDQPILITGERRGGGRVAALGLDLTATDLPLRIAFPLLVTNTIHWLADVQGPAGRTLRAGESMELEEADRVSATPMLENGAKAPAQGATTATSAGIFQPMRNGYYEFQRNGKKEWIAVNTFSPQESDLRATSAAETPSAPADVRASHALAGLNAWPLWRWLALGALALFTAEWSLFHRRRTE